MARRKQQAARREQPAVTRARFRRWLPLPLVATALALASWAFAEGVVTLPEAPDFPIRTLKVEATFERVSAQEVAAVVAPLVAEGFFETDVGSIKQGLNALPWVRNVAVRRVWPDALHVTVIEQAAVALWADEGLLNPDGELFMPADRARIDGLPLLEGPPRTSQQVMAQYQRLSSHLDPLGLGIERLSMDPRRAWKVTLDNGITLVLGRRDAEHQLQRFVRYWPGVIAARAAEIAEVDLRYPSGFAVKWQAAGAQARAGDKAGANTGRKTGDRV